uniref:Uncharacterized protein n=1 Tax=Chromera velia CCMP2878 TaxID=1169474 RepID=A0A0G4F9G6_9ALVE|eukprot:Cvel_15872.t1-p1 / transcript=Cvel_15872.t1 / gene=Cvel_15872 / organism=Chromera_velia_CCMP2878 / gene_product=Disintegrin and metalloproteinase domain-containing, putative / transcript_product=Disintegrin and metalloproteinase domain-containing, putative / location=Cvel_scaffold1197:41600-42181(+) / protein_length=194 / sequence_SO=supercontig / SO=protein_coding / is_pseudo=false
MPQGYIHSLVRAARFAKNQRRVREGLKPVCEGPPFSSRGRGPQIILPESNPQIVPPESNPQIVPPESNPEIVPPESNLQIVPPESNPQIVPPESNLQIIPPESNPQIVLPESNPQITPPKDYRSDPRFQKILLEVSDEIDIGLPEEEEEEAEAFHRFQLLLDEEAAPSPQRSLSGRFTEGSVHSDYEGFVQGMM